MKSTLQTKQLKKLCAICLLIASCTLLFLSANSQAEIKVGEAQSPWDRTKEIDDGTRKEQYQLDMEEVEKYYDDCAEQTDLQGVECLNIRFNHIDNYDCYYYAGPIHLTAVALYGHCYNFPHTFPYREYWMAFQKGEQVQVPFTTAFVTYGDIATYLMESEKILYEAAPSLMKGDGGTKGVLQRLQEASDKHKWEIETDDSKIKETTEEVVKELTKFDALKYRFRNAIPESGGYRYMVGHIFSTRLHETYAFDDKYNNFPSKQGHNWVHYGAKNAGKWVSLDANVLYGIGSLAGIVGQHNTEKPEIPDWLSEAPTPKGGTFSGILLNNFYGPTTKYFSDMIFYGGNSSTTFNCMKMRMGRDTPQDIISPEHHQKLNTDESMREQYQYCLPGMHGAKFGMPMGIVDTYYATVADNVAFYRNLRAAYRIGNKLLAPGEFHDLQEVQEGDHKRDRIQFLGDGDGGKRGRKGEFFKKGCSPFKGFDHFIPDITGPEYGDANKYVGIDTGEYFRSVHWRYLRGCPVSQGGLSCYYPGLPGGTSNCECKHAPTPGSIMPTYILK